MMTIGSPLNKHLLLWPKLVQGFTPGPSIPSLPGKIRWRNYYDFGDPVGFKLDRTRKWLAQYHWDPFFEFDDKPEHDIGFTRYWFPGEAHNDYWDDAQVFRHFIDNVMLDAENPADQKVMAELKALDQKKQPDAIFPSRPPESRFGPALISPMIPYLLAACTLLVGVFLLYRGVAALSPTFAEKPADTAWNVVGITLALAGATAGVRIPRLTKRKPWRAIGIAVFLASWLSLPWFLTDTVKDRLEAPLGLVLGPRGFDQGLLPTPAADTPGAGVVGFAKRYRYDDLTMAVLLGLILIASVVVFWITRYCPQAGVKPLIFIGVALMASVIAPRFLPYDSANDLAVADAIDRLLAETRSEVLHQAGREAKTLDPSIVDAVSIELVRKFTNSSEAQAQPIAERPI